VTNPSFKLESTLEAKSMVTRGQSDMSKSILHPKVEPNID